MARPSASRSDGAPARPGSPRPGSDGSTGGPRRPDRRQKLTSYRALGIGVELGTAIGGLAALGYFADRRFDTDPWLALTGAMLGLIGGVYNVIREVRRFR